MPNSYKDILITPNTGLAANPNIAFRGGNASANTEVTLRVYPDNNGTLSFEASSGNLLSITNNLSSTLTVAGNLTSGNANLGNAIRGNYFIGDGGLLSNIAATAGSNLTNGTSNLIVYPSSNVRVSVSGTSNIVDIGSSSTLIASNLAISGNTRFATGSGGTLTGANLVSANFFQGNGSLLTSVAGGNVTGTVANATYALSAGSAGSATTAATVTTAAQPNITSLGTLTSLTMSNITGSTNGIYVQGGSTTGAHVSSFVNNLGGDNGINFTIYGNAYASGSYFNVGANGIAITGNTSAQMAFGTIGANATILGANNNAIMKLYANRQVEVLAPASGVTAVKVNCGDNEVGVQINGTNPYYFLTPGVSGHNWALQAVNGTTGFRIYDSTRGAQTIAVSNDGSVSIDTPANSAIGLTVAANMAIGTTSARGNLSIGRATSGTTQSHVLHFGYTPLDYYGFRINNTNDPAAEAAGNLDIQRGGVISWINVLNINNNGAISITAAASGNTLTVNGNTVANNAQITSLGVGTAASGTAGEIRATNNITAYYSSDSRLKQNVKPIADAVMKVKQLSGVEFDWTDAYIKAHGGQDGYFIRKHDIGVIAQEVQKVLPEIVATRPSDGMLAVKYEKMVSLLIEAIKEQDAKIEKLEQLVSKLSGGE